MRNSGSALRADLIAERVNFGRRRSKVTSELRTPIRLTGEREHCTTMTTTQGTSRTKKHGIITAGAALLLTIGVVSIGSSEPAAAKGGVIEGAGNVFHVKNSVSSGVADKVVVYGNSGDTVLVGDWDGDGVVTVAVRRGNVFHVKNSVSSGVADKVVVYGNSGDTVLVGDWDG
ncbi:MAG: hypothetical protein ACYC1Z_05560, partial [Georgenia sp.]